MMLRSALALMAIFGWLSAAANAADPVGNISELDRTYRAAAVYSPDPSGQGYKRSTVANLHSGAEAYAGRVKGIVIYAHGCDGLSRITDTTGTFLARAGYIVVAPDSFARQHKPVSCEPSRYRGSLHRGVLGWRQSEIRNAYEEIRGDPRLARFPVFLMGHSEGAIAVATVGGIRVAARIIEGWTCHAAWPEYRGIKAPPNQPVLALVGADDPWFRAPALRGDCGAYMMAGRSRQSVVYRAPSHLRDKHWLSFDGGVQKRILSFLEVSRR